MKNTRRFLSAALAAAVFGTATAYVAAAATDITAGTTTLSAGEYSLSGDVTLTGTLVVPQGVTATIDLNGHTLTGPNNTAIIVNGTLTVKDSGTGGKIVGNNKANQNYNISVTNTGTLNWESGEFEDAGVDGMGSPVRLTSINVGTNYSGGTLNITGGTFTASGGTKVANLIQAANPDSMTISDAEIDTDRRALVLGADTDISDSTIKGEIMVGVGSSSAPEVTITDSTVTGNIGSGGNNGSATVKPTVTVSGGTFTGSVDYGSAAGKSGNVKFESGVSGKINGILNASNATAGQLEFDDEMGLAVDTGSVSDANNLLPSDSGVKIDASGAVVDATTPTYKVTGAQKIDPATKITDSADRAAAAKLIYDIISVSKTTDTVTVTFSKTKAQVQSIVNGNDILKAGAGHTTAGGVAGVDPIYLVIETDITGVTAPSGFNFVSGYGWDDGNNGATHPEWNYDNGDIKLWLPATFTGDKYVIKYSVNGEEQTLNIIYKYKTTTSSSGSSSGSSTKPSTTANTTETKPTTNPDTGITLAVVPVILAAGAAIVATKKRK